MESYFHQGGYFHYNCLFDLFDLLKGNKIEVLFVAEELPAVTPDCDNTNRTNWAFIQSIRKYGELQLRGDRTVLEGSDSSFLSCPASFVRF